MNAFNTLSESDKLTLFTKLTNHSQRNSYLSAFNIVLNNIDECYDNNVHLTCSSYSEVFDTGSNVHIWINKDDFSLYTPFSEKEDCVQTIGAGKVKALGTGEVKIKWLDDADK